MSDNSTLTLRLLGTGSSGGVPRIGNDWGACDPAEPRNRRRRCAALVQKTTQNGSTTVLIDTPPDLREQLIDAATRHLDSVFFTHAHADQCHGIDDLRVIAMLMRQQVDVWMDAPTSQILTSRFDYCFKQPKGSPYPPILRIAGQLAPLDSVTIDGEGGAIEFLTLDQDHGSVRSLGFRMGPIAYCNDVVQLPDETMNALMGVEILIVDALRYAPHPTHAHLARSLEWIEAVGARQGVLTNLHVDLDYQTLCKELPDHVIPGYDGLEVSCKV